MCNRRFQVFFFLTALVLSLTLTILVFRSYLTLLAFGGVLAIVSMPLYRYLKKFLKSPSISAISTVVLVAVVILLPLLFFLSAMAGEIYGAFSNYRSQIDSADVMQFLYNFLPQSVYQQIPKLMDQSFNIAAKLAEFLSSNIISLFSNVFSVFFGFFVVLICMYYLLKDGRRMKNKLLTLSPLANESDELVLDKIAAAVRAVMGGILVIAVIKSILSGFFYWIFGIPAPLFWGGLTGVASFVPIFGISLTTVPIVIYLFAIGKYASGIAILAIALTTIGPIDNFLQPKLIENKTKIHPLLILLSILGGLKFYGFAGFILGPLTLSVTLALLDIYEKQFRGRIDDEMG